ncbi:uncharacterized protein LOC114575466 [Exaiptasia diaphana]|uniref:EGF-like domain-containing protein n=1 Tax=Exaiptasia diaphana TaxID=2652724 RepID=A0A913YL62_EXADI|nr:uncharacterized protein LOC114575466 [Exaiptasia diaphana]
MSMLATLLISTALLCGIASGKFQCVGTCYSGHSHPRDVDTFQGKYIKGYSYKNLTTTDHVTCYRSCIQDCRCQACQIKGDRCELLDADNKFSGVKFNDEEGYVYYDLAQTQYKGSLFKDNFGNKSHMNPPDGCYNGCCKMQPCLNGGTCQDLCQTPKQKFFCRCPHPFTGRVCQMTASSCLDFLRNSHTKLPPNGKYTIYRSDNGSPLDVYCDFKTPHQVFTLIESYSRDNKDLSVYQKNPYHDDFPRHMDALPKWDDYRLSLSAMKYIRTKSSLFRATCEFQKRMGGSLKPDFLLGSLSDYDIINNGDVIGVTICKRYKYINIRNQEYYNQTALTYSKSNVHHIHIEPDSFCGFVVSDEGVSEEFFGVYNPIYPTFKCVETGSSTTQWWLGEELY